MDMQRYPTIKHGYIHVIVLNRAKKMFYECIKHKLQKKHNKTTKNCSSVKIQKSLGPFGKNSFVYIYWY